MAGLLKVALIYGHNGYLILVYVFAAAGIGLGAIVATGKAAIGGGRAFNSYFISVVAGLCFFSAMVIPTGILHVYDRSTNQTQDIQLPLFVVAIAGTLNELETSIIDIIETTPTYVTTNQSYINNSGGLSYKLLQDALAHAQEMHNSNVTKNLHNYTKECYITSVAMNGGSDPETLNDDVFNLLTASTVYDGPVPWADNAGTTTITCSEAEVRLLNILSTNGAGSDFDLYAQNICTKTGYNVSNAVAYQRCKDQLTTSMIERGTVISEADAIRQLQSTYLTNSILTALKDNNTAQLVKSVTDQSVQSQNLGIGEMANEWLPMIKGTIIAISFGLTPLIALLVVTPLFGRTIVYIIGVFTWLTVWNIVDAITHGFAVDFAGKVYDSIVYGGVGMQEILNMPDASARAAGLFGKAKSASIMMSATLVYALFRFGGIAFANQAASTTEGIQQQGAKAGTAAGTPQGQAQTFGGINSAQALMANAVANGGLQSVINSNAWQAAKTTNQNNKEKAIMNGNVDDMGGGAAIASTSNAKSFIKTNADLGGDAQSTVNAISDAKSVEQQKQAISTQEMMDQYGSRSNLAKALSGSAIQTQQGQITAADYLSNHFGGHMMAGTAGGLGNAISSLISSYQSLPKAQQEQFLGSLAATRDINTALGIAKAFNNNMNKAASTYQDMGEADTKVSSGRAHGQLLSEDIEGVPLEEMSAKQASVSTSEGFGVSSAKMYAADRSGITVGQNAEATTTLTSIMNGDQIRQAGETDSGFSGIAENAHAVGSDLSQGIPVSYTYNPQNGKSSNVAVNDTQQVNTSKKADNTESLSNNTNADMQVVMDAMKGNDPAKWQKVYEIATSGDSGVRAVAQGLTQGMFGANLGTQTQGTDSVQTQAGIKPLAGIQALLGTNIGISGSRQLTSSNANTTNMETYFAAQVQDAVNEAKTGNPESAGAVFASRLSNGLEQSQQEFLKIAGNQDDKQNIVGRDNHAGSVNNGIGGTISDGFSGIGSQIDENARNDISNFTSRFSPSDVKERMQADIESLTGGAGESSPGMEKLHNEIRNRIEVKIRD
jgi:conjugal transfer mating pair stabilization protein TraG